MNYPKLAERCLRATAHDQTCGPLSCASYIHSTPTPCFLYFRLCLPGSLVADAVFGIFLFCVGQLQGTTANSPSSHTRKIYEKILPLPPDERRSIRNGKKTDFEEVLNAVRLYIQPQLFCFILSL